MQALAGPFCDGLRQPPELLTGKIRRRVRCTKRFCCSAAKLGMHVAGIEFLRIFETIRAYLCFYKD
jgi:hypothetical protein